jgi:peptide/nickel transport system substrate-binding protein
MFRRLIVVLLAVVFSVASLQVVYSESPTNSITIAYSSAVGNLDPHSTTYTDAVGLRYQIFEGLVWLDEELEIQPRLAKSWQVSEDGKTYTFKLREGVKFHDNTKFDAYVAKANFDRTLTAEWDSSVKAYLEPIIDSVEVVNDYTFAVITKEPYAPFLNILGVHSGLLASPKAIEEYGSEYAGLDEAPIGTGPFKLDEWVKGERIVLRRYEEYWGGASEIEEITYLIVPESGARLAMLETGEADIILRITADDAKYLQGVLGVEILKSPTNRVMHFALNVNHPPLDDVRIRKAINYALDVQKIIDTILGGAGRLMDCPVAPQTWGYNSIMTYDYDPDKAKELMAEAGYSNGFSFTLEAPKGRYVLDYLVAEAVQAELKKAGIKAGLKLWGDFPAYLSYIGSEERGDAMLLGWATSTLDADGGMYQVLHPERANKFANASGYTSSKFGNLMDSAKGELDRQKRLELYRQAEELVMDEAPWLFLYYQDVFTGIQDRVKGVVFKASGQLVVRDAWIEEE